MALPYIGNPDYRGYLNYLAQNGDKSAATLIGSNGGLGFVNNQGQLTGGGVPLAPNVIDYNTKTYNTYKSLAGVGSDSGSYNVTGGTAGGSSSSSYDPASAAAYGATLNNIKSTLATLPSEQALGENNIRNSADLSRRRLNDNESQVLSDIAHQDQVANTNKVKSLSSIDANVANTIDSFRRLMAAGHSGNSAFAHDFVPIATARQGTQNRQGVLENFANDEYALDNTKKKAQTDYQNSNEDITNQMNDKLMQFIQGINAQRQTLNQNAADAAANEAIALGQSPGQVSAAVAPFQSKAADAIAALKSLFSQYGSPSYNVKPVSVTLPNLSQYTFDPLVARLSAENPGVSSSLLPYLLQQKKPGQSLVGA